MRGHYRTRLLIFSIIGFFILASFAFAEAMPKRPIPRPLLNDSLFISQVVPSTMTAGQKYSVQITFKNIGLQPWFSLGGYYLASQNPKNNRVWSVNRIDLSRKEIIFRNKSKTFSFEITAPSNPGSYNFQWQMYNKRLGFFGQKTPNISIDVYPPLALGPIEDKATYEHKLIEFKVTAQGPPSLVYSAANLPPGSTFNPQTRSFNWLPAHGQAGIYNDISFEVKDSAGNTASRVITATVLKTIVFGTIYEKDENNQLIGLGGATIQVFDISRANVLAEGTTDPAGHFDLFKESWPDGNYFIKASKPGYKTYWGFALIRANTMMPFSVTLLKLPPKEYWVIVDEMDNPLPSQGYYYNCTGGDRGISDSGGGYISYSWDNISAYTTTVVNNPPSTKFGGLNYGLIRIKEDQIPIDFKNVFGNFVKPEYQGEVTDIEVVVSGVVSPSLNPQLGLKIELKDENGISYDHLLTGITPGTYAWSLPEENKKKIKLLTWLMVNAVEGDSVSIDRIRLKIKAPSLSTEDEAFLWSYSWLMANYDPATGMVQDRSNFGSGDFENVTATAKAAKITYYAYRKGIVTQETARAIITKIADTLIDVVPKGPTGVNLWPHFTKNGGTTVVADSEWASGDTAYAALDIIAALQMIGGPQDQIAALEQFVTGIGWESLILSDGSISHGYTPGGTLMSASWKGFGMETVGVDWAYASSRDKLASMEEPPSDNGSGFIDNAQYPMAFSGTVRNIDWTKYRNDMANKQIGWYSAPEHLNMFLRDAGLFGLSASDIPETGAYKVYGTGGRHVGLEDGDGEVVVLHYSGMVADIKPVEAKRMWEVLRDRKYPNGSDVPFLNRKVIISPLNNMESMRVDKNTGEVIVNYLKGSWNLSLQAEGWAQTDPMIRNDLNNAVQNNVFLKRGFDKLHAPVAVLRVPQDYTTIQSAIGAANSGDTIEIGPGLCNENVMISKPRLTLKGNIGDYANPLNATLNTVVNSNSGLGIFINQAGNITVDSIVITGANRDYFTSYGGAIYVYLSDDAVINNNIITANRAAVGAGVCSSKSKRITISNNIFMGNDGHWGGAIFAGNTDYSPEFKVTIRDNKIIDNLAWESGAGITVSKADVSICRNLIYHNVSDWYGGLNAQYSHGEIKNNVIIKNEADYKDGAAITCVDSPILIANNVIYDNKCTGSPLYQSSGIYISGEEIPVIKNNIIAKNGHGGIYYTGSSTLSPIFNALFDNVVDYTGCTPGEGFVSEDPEFVAPDTDTNPDNDDYHLQAGSPCINAGDPNPVFNDKDGTRNDMGVYGGPDSLP